MLINDKYKILTPSGFQDFDGIKKETHKSYIKILLSNKYKRIVIRCSLNHKIFNNGKIILAKKLNIGDILFNKQSYKIINIKKYNRKIDLFEILDVKNGNLYIANNIIQHNCQFLGSGNTLISSSGLSSLAIQRPIEVKDEEKFRIHEYPEKEHSYVCVCDMGEGLGEDASTIQVIKVSVHPWKQVAVYQNNIISTNDFPMPIERIAMMYNEALVIGENNSIGEGVLIDVIYDLEYENVFYNLDESKTKHGLRMTTKSKKLGCAYLKKYIENGNLEIFDEQTIYELSVFVKKGNSYAADGDDHDDLVTPLILFSYFMRKSAWVEEWCNIDMDIDKKRKKLQQKIEDDVLPAGWVNRGHGIEDLNNKSNSYLSYLN